MHFPGSQNEMNARRVSDTNGRSVDRTLRDTGATVHHKSELEKKKK